MRSAASLAPGARRLGAGAARETAHHGLGAEVCNHFSVELPDGSGRFLLDPRGLLWREVQAAERCDGKFIVHTNDDTLTPEDMALGYKQLIRVEWAWHDMKSTRVMRPVFHWAPHRGHAHVAITVLSLLLERTVERTVERACADTWRNVSDRLRRIQLAQLSSPRGTVWQVTDPLPEAAKCSKSLQVKHPPPVLQLA